MKTLMFIACLLAVAYASDPEKVKAFNAVAAKCSEELGVPPNSVDPKVLQCVAEKSGLYDEQGVIIKDKTIEYVDGIVSDAHKDQAREIISNCIEKEWQGSASNDVKAIAGINCIIQQNLMEMIEKPPQ